MKSTLDTRRIIIFVALACAIAWAFALWIKLAGGLANSPEVFAGTGITLAFVLLAGGYMFAPTVAVILTRIITREGWKDLNIGLHLEGWRAWIGAWLLPIIMMALGAVVYFAIFPAEFDPNLGVVQGLLAQVEAQTGQSINMDPITLLALQLGVGAFTAPFVNSFFTFGEEFGWRAYLQPKLMPLGFRKAMLILGVVWGLWHWPIIAMGHNYGLDYWGAPWTGILAMTWFTITVGTVFGWLTLRAKSVWPAVIGHAVLNGFAGTPIYFLAVESTPNSLLGPVATGLVAGIPWTLLALYLLWKGGPSDAADVSRETSPKPGRKPPKTTAISARGLTKRFGSVTAVEGLDLEIPAGEVFGLLGPNGAGKTTTIRMLAALIQPSQGEAWVAGYRVGDDDTAIRSSVGILTETPGLYEQLSAERNLAFFARMYDVKNIDAQVKKYLGMLGLWSRRSEPVGTFSKGMRQKLAIARALLHEPRVLFLDEPTSALDPESARTVREFISELKSQGRTLILCTHNLDEADRLCDRVAVFKTRMLAMDTPTNLRRQLFGRSVVFHLAKAKQAFAKLLLQKSYVQSVDLVDNRLIVKLDDPDKRNPELISTLVAEGAQIRFVGEMRQSLEDVYLQLIDNEVPA
jgi:ABC-2 type transport system ATP-binding protein